MASDPKPLEWSVIHCLDDDSHVLVERDEVIGVGELSADDRVNFWFVNESGKRKIYTGDIKAISGDYKAMKKFQDEINAKTKPKREPSFNASKPRKAKMACKQLITKKVGATSATNTKPSKRVQIVSSDSETESQQADVIMTANNDTPSDDNGTTDMNIDEESNDDSGDDHEDMDKSDGDSSDSSSRSLNERELQLFKKLSQKIKTKTAGERKSSVRLQPQESLGSQSKDVKQKQKEGSDSKSSDAISKPKVSVEPPSKKLKPSECKESGSSNSESSSSHSVEVQRISQLVGPKRVRREISQITFKGTFLAYAESEKNVAISEDYSVFIPKAEMKHLKNTCGGSSILTRRLTRLVFTQEARENCSVSGKSSMTKGQEVPEVRTALPQDGVRAIIDFVTSRAQKKGWGSPPELSIKQWMANVLCEERKNKDLREQATKKSEQSDQQ